jgi:hypothetical protein
MGKSFQQVERRLCSQRGLEITYSYMAKEYVTLSTEVKEFRWNGREIRNGKRHATLGFAGTCVLIYELQLSKLRLLLLYLML